MIESGSAGALLGSSRVFTPALTEQAITRRFWQAWLRSNQNLTEGKDQAHTHKRYLAQLKVYDKDRQRAPNLTDALSRRLMKSDPSTALPEPHILDYDWRYTAQTVLDLSALVRPSDTVLAVGTPSLARHLEAATPKPETR